MAVTVQVKMLGTFSLSVDDRQINDIQNRSKKVWALLAYLICNHHRIVPQTELLDLLWDDDRDTANPVSALKTTLHRVRTLLDQLIPDGGRTMIISKNGGYGWNNQVALELDFAAFEQLCKTPVTEDDMAVLNMYRQALQLYSDPFLNKMNAETWVIPLRTYYHNLYLQTTTQTLERMETHGMWEDAEKICRAALKQEPYQENFYQHLMRNLLAMGNQSQAAAVFESMNKLLLSNLGVMPDQESRSLYREALRTVNKKTVPSAAILEQLRETSPITGALICDFDFFKMLCQAEARRMARSGDATHIGILSLTDGRGKDLTQKSLETAIDNLEAVIKTNLRKGDAVSRCSPSQLAIMLPQANFEDSGMVCRRVVQAFFRKYPHSPAKIDYIVYPLEPIRNDLKNE